MPVCKCLSECVCLRETERAETHSTFDVYTAPYIHNTYNAVCVYVCICVYFGPPIVLKCLWVRPGPGLIMVPV